MSNKLILPVVVGSGSATTDISAALSRLRPGERYSLPRDRTIEVVRALVPVEVEDNVGSHSVLLRKLVTRVLPTVVEVKFEEPNPTFGEELAFANQVNDLMMQVQARIGVTYRINEDSLRKLKFGIAAGLLNHPDKVAAMNQFVKMLIANTISRYAGKSDELVFVETMPLPPQRLVRTEFVPLEYIDALASFAKPEVPKVKEDLISWPGFTYH